LGKEAAGDKQKQAGKGGKRAELSHKILLLKSIPEKDGYDKKTRFAFTEINFH
jgi:hypothetical protein